MAQVVAENALEDNEDTKMIQVSVGDSRKGSLVPMSDEIVEAWNDLNKPEFHIDAILATNSRAREFLGVAGDFIGRWPSTTFADVTENISGPTLFFQRLT